MVHNIKINTVKLYDIVWHLHLTVIVISIVLINRQINQYN